MSTSVSMPPNLHSSVHLPTTLAALIADARPSATFLVVDEVVAQLHKPEVDAVAALCQSRFTAPSGEQYKTLDTTQRIWQWLLDEGADRKALVIALGGGVVTDMTAFAASTYMRGVRFILCPSTLLSQVDASMGGKTGIDFAGGKNLVGTFAEPEAVVIAPHLLHTLPPRELRSGYAEVLKHGIIADAAYWHAHKGISPAQADPAHMVQRSIAIKYDVVRQDPREQGLRKTLNFGHTLGHAIESYWLVNSLPAALAARMAPEEARLQQHLLHGEAIALGMCLVADLAVELCGFPATDRDDIWQHLAQLGYPGAEYLPPADALFAYLRMDKKNQHGQLRFSLPDVLGHCRWDVEVPPALVRSLLEGYAA